MGIWLPMPKIRSRLIVASAWLFLFAGASNAQRSAIDTYAITNARIVTVSGPVIERGTVVIRNGLIAAAGANVTAPVRCPRYRRHWTDCLSGSHRFIHKPCATGSCSFAFSGRWRGWRRFFLFDTAAATRRWSKFNATRRLAARSHG